VHILNSGLHPQSRTYCKSWKEWESYIFCYPVRRRTLSTNWAFAW